jgi:Family of unknown function (DUF6328)
MSFRVRRWTPLAATIRSDRSPARNEVVFLAETHKERVDRELIELLNELRVVLPGVQVLFGFLLLLPFQQTFGQLGELERSVYFIAFLASAAASVLLIAPSTYHRVRFRDPDKERLVRHGNRFLLAGTIGLGVALAATAFLITDVMFGFIPGLVVAIGAVVLVAAAWYVLPLRRKAGSEDSGPPSG